MVARGLGLSSDETADLVYAARVHDVGKIFVSESILNKPGPLSDEEFLQIMMHPRMWGGDRWELFRTPTMMREALEFHHQRFDGSGYPDGRRGEEIPLWARIIALTDALRQHGDGAVVLCRRGLRNRLSTNWSKMSGTRFDGMLVRYCCGD